MGAGYPVTEELQQGGVLPGHEHFHVKVSIISGLGHILEEGTG